jgi:PAS domain S-box-containing protein
MRRLKSTIFAAVVLTFWAWATPNALAQSESEKRAVSAPRNIVAVVPRSWPPQYDVDADEKPIGFAIDVMNAIAARAGLSVTYIVAEDFATADRMLKRGDADLIPNSGILSERLDEFSFTEPVETFSVSLFVRAETNDINGVADLVGRKLAVVDSNIGQFMFGNRSDIEVQVYQNIRSALFELLAGHADALVYPEPVIWAISRPMGIDHRFKVVGASLREVKRGIRVRKDSVALLALLRPAVDGFIGTPAYRQIYQKWYGAPEPYWTAQRVLWALGSLLVAMLVVMSLWRYRSVVSLNRELKLSISRREKAEEARRESDQQFRRIFEDGPLGMGIIRPDGRLADVNDAFCQMVGYTPDELRNLSFADITHPDDIDANLDLQGKIFRGDIDHYQIEKRYIRKTGEPVWAKLTASVIRDDQGAPDYGLGMVEDITARRRSEFALKESEARFSAFFDNAPFGMAIFDDRVRFVKVNSMLAEWNGMSQEDHIGKSLYDVFPENAAAVEASYRRIMESGKREPPVEYSDIAQIETGNIRSWQITRFPIFGTDNNPVALGVVAADITEHKRAEEALRQSQKMEAVGQFTGGVAHEFNNLLMIVVGNLDYAKDMTEEGKEVRIHVERALAAADRGAALTQRLLAFSRKQVLRPTPTDLNDLQPGLLDLLRPALGEAIAVESVFADDLWLASVDRDQMETAVLSLALNARDAMPRGGELIIEAANVRLGGDDIAEGSEAEPGDYVLLSVTDTGAGMPPEVMEHVFEPFFTTKEVGKGTGLGLSMVHGFVKQSGGHIEIASEVGGGTTVRIYLPRASETSAQSDAELDVDPAYRGKGETILVVEDDPAVRALLVRMLTGLGYETVEAGDGETALAILDETPGISLLFTDVILPNGMSGGELAREAQRRWPDIKVLHTSGYPDESIAHHGQIDDGVELLRKPYRISTLARKVRETLDSRA